MRLYARPSARSHSRASMSGLNQIPLGAAHARLSTTTTECPFRNTNGQCSVVRDRLLPCPGGKPMSIWDRTAKGFGPGASRVFPIVPLRRLPPWRTARHAGRPSPRIGRRNLREGCAGRRCIVVRRILVGVSIFVAATSLVVVSAGAAVPPQGKVGPHQVFGGLVNGKNGVPAPAVIRMACFGPVRPGQTGHPMAGQTVEVFRPEAIVGHFGNTGAHATSIVAFFGPPPPTSAPPTPSASTVTFYRYGVVKPIPTALVLPCGGTGTVSFVPLPQSPPTSRDATVRVSYVGQP